MDKLKLEDLISIKEDLEYIISMMEDKNVKDLHLACSTYGLYETMLSIPGKGYLEIPRAIEALEDENEDEYDTI